MLGWIYISKIDILELGFLGAKGENWLTCPVNLIHPDIFEWLIHAQFSLKSLSGWYANFKHILEIQHTLTKHYKDNYLYSSNDNFSFRYFQKMHYSQKPYQNNKTFFWTAEGANRYEYSLGNTWTMLHCLYSVEQCLFFQICINVQHIKKVTFFLDNIYMLGTQRVHG